MEIAVVDDLVSDAETLNRTLEVWFAENRLDADITIYMDGETLLQAFVPGRFDVIFLDILLGDGKTNGIDVARQIRAVDEEQLIVFTTTEQSFALEGFAVQALDYLVKPFTPQRGDSVMRRVRKARQPEAYMEIQEGRDVRRIPLGAILYVATVKRAVEIYTEQGVFKTYMTFSEAAAQLEDSRFACCSRGVLVNLDQVKRMEEQDFLLYTGERLPISRAKRAGMKEAYTSRLFDRSRIRGEGVK